MKTRRSTTKILLVLVLGLALSGVLGLAPPAAQASIEDAAIFYEELAQYGNWREDERHGPVWSPKGVEEGWRPYLNGRWNPTEQGYVFETQEPWGWATYHYGNWMPTESHGWVWVPGRTWYPNTVNWRTNEDYVGWAPVPPPDYVPPASYAPAGGYSPGLSPLDLITAPFYIFAKAASFLLGFGQPYAPAYSYLDSGALAPPSYVPVIYSRTVVVNNYVVPNYYPAGYFRRAPCTYAWGPPLPYVSRVTRINPALLNQHLRRVHLAHIHNGLAGGPVLARRPYLRQIVPAALVAGKPLPRMQWMQNSPQARANLNRPDVIPPAKEVPRFTATLPKAEVRKMEHGRGIPGTSLPPRAMQPLTPGMVKQIDQLPPEKRIVPWSAPPRGAAVTKDRGTTESKSALPPRVKPGAAAAPATNTGAGPTPPQVRGAGPEHQRTSPRVAAGEAGPARRELSQEQRERLRQNREVQARQGQNPPARQAQWQQQQAQRQQEMQQRRQQQIQRQRQQEIQGRQQQWQQQQAQRQQEMQQRRQQEMQRRQQQWQQRQQELA
ncbi:MAG: DUF6600 domain-containing protein, partial [Thermodesulfobacteriota bacterium]